MNEKVYSVLCPFGGIGAGALGFQRAETRLFETRARFQLLGGIDNNAEACGDFEYLTGAPELCADIWELEPADLRARFGAKAPDVVFLSPPCKGASGLLSEEQSKTAKYRKLNQLALRWIKMMLEAWADAPPRLVLFENVPRIVTRARRVLGAVRGLLRRAGYVLHEGTHDCGELGGLAQRRKRFLLVARHTASVSSLLYQPVKKRVRGCGELLGRLPMPNDPAAGPMHRLPAIGWLNWVRLALIPAGGDWRDLPGVLAEGEERRAKFKRHAVEEWDAPTGTVGGSGSNGVENVADPRLPAKIFRKNDAPEGAENGSIVQGTAKSDSKYSRKYSHPLDSAGIHVDAAHSRGTESRQCDCGHSAEAHASIGRESFAECDECSCLRYQPKPIAAAFEGFRGVLGVTDWGSAMPTVTGRSMPSTGRFAVADPRLNLGENAHTNVMRVTDWEGPSGTVTGAPRPGQGAISIADPRVVPQASNPNMHHGKYEVRDWAEPVGTVTGASRPGSGAQGVADPRGPGWFANVLRVIPWGEPTGTVTSSPSPSSGGVAVADPRVKTAYPHGYMVLPWEAPSFTVAAGSMPGQGAYSVADPRPDRAALLGLVALEAARATVTGEIPSPFAVVDPKSDGAPLMIVRDIAKAPPIAPVILAADGTWHRPLTTLELAVLQGLPHEVNGEPLRLAGTSSRQREGIGNAVPVQAAQAIAEQMLLTLLSSDLQAFALSSGGAVWVSPESRSPAIEGEAS